MTKIYAMTEKGEHIENEDRILINDTIVSVGTFETECDSNLKMCVADGVGGNTVSQESQNSLTKTQLKTFFR